MTPLLLAAALLLPSPARADDAPAIMFIGDSHSAGTFGQLLDRDLRSQKGKVATFAVCSAKPQSFLSETEHACGYLFRDFDKKQPGWTNAYQCTRKIRGEDKIVTCVTTPKLSKLMTDYKPAAVIVALGSNGLNASSVKQMVDAIHAKPDTACFWIGPPRMKSVPDAELDGYYRVLNDNKVGEKESPLGESCKMILDSRKPTYLVYPDNKNCDGTHYECPAAAELVTRWSADAYNGFVDALKAP
jgi:hypothetical protein